MNTEKNNTILTVKLQKLEKIIMEGQEKPFAYKAVFDVELTIPERAAMNWRREERSGLTFVKWRDENGEREECIEERLIPLKYPLQRFLREQINKPSALPLSSSCTVEYINAVERDLIVGGTVALEMIV